jgi:hypothetical protein
MPGSLFSCVLANLKLTFMIKRFLVFMVGGLLIVGVMCKKHTPKDAPEVTNINGAILVYPVTSDAGMVGMLDQIAVFNWLNFDLQSNKGAKLENESDFTWTSGRYAGDDSSNVPLLNQRPDWKKLKSWQQNHSVLFSKLVQSSYLLNTRIYGHIYPVASQEVRTSENIVFVGVDIGAVKPVQFKLTNQSELDLVRSYTDRWNLVFRDKSKTLSCIWSAGNGRISEGVLSVFINVPCSVEGWLVLDVPDISKRGKGFPLISIEIPGRLQDEECVSIGLDLTQGRSPLELPDWVKVAPPMEE